ncbi:MAG: sulfur transferase domain-containing protein [Woeseiaceae bacterium]|nr:sulfur transferase domain-containing protein [Woeseiaceae bacterium]
MQQDYLQIRVMELAPQVFVSGQLFEHDVRLLARQGCRSIVCTEPDTDAAGRPKSADLARVAEEEGVVFVHFPVDPGSVTADDAEAFGRACEDLKRPVHVFSRSAAHAIKLWEMSE